MLMSDTHENYPAALRAVDSAGDIDTVIHLGDGCNDAKIIAQALDIEVKLVSGNCDLGSKEPREILCECAGKRILITHGDRYGVKGGMRILEQRGLEVGADAVFFGHTHLATIITMSGILFINPGTLIKSSQQKSYAIVEISPTGITASLQNIS